MYSGYLNVGDHKKYYYAFVYSLNNPSEDPLVVQLPGGPG
jgi:carboxypeptidase C (cathepsin A)